MPNPPGRGRFERMTRRVGVTIVLAGTLASLAGNLTALAATLPVGPSSQLRRSLELGYRFWFDLSGRCVGLAFGCLLACWVLSIWDRLVEDTTQARSRRLIRRLNVTSLVVAIFVPAYATRF